MDQARPQASRQSPTKTKVPVNVISDDIISDDELLEGALEETLGVGSATAASDTSTEGGSNDALDAAFEELLGTDDGGAGGTETESEIETGTSDVSSNTDTNGGVANADAYEQEGQRKEKGQKEETVELRSVAKADEVNRSAEAEDEEASVIDESEFHDAIKDQSVLTLTPDISKLLDDVDAFNCATRADPYDSDDDLMDAHADATESSDDLLVTSGENGECEVNEGATLTIRTGQVELHATESDVEHGDESAPTLDDADVNVGIKCTQEKPVDVEQDDDWGLEVGPSQSMIASSKKGGKKSGRKKKGKGKGKGKGDGDVRTEIEDGKRNVPGAGAPGSGGKNFRAGRVNELLNDTEADAAQREAARHEAELIRKEDELEAATKMKAEKEAAARKRAEEQALAKAKAEEEAAAKARADEEAEKRRAEQELAAKAKAQRKEAAARARREHEQALERGRQEAAERARLERLEKEQVAAIQRAQIQRSFPPPPSICPSLPPSSQPSSRFTS